MARTTATSVCTINQQLRNLVQKDEAESYKYTYLVECTLTIPPAIKDMYAARTGRNMLSEAADAIRSAPLANGRVTEVRCGMKRVTFNVPCIVSQQDHALAWSTGRSAGRCLVTDRECMDGVYAALDDVHHDCGRARMRSAKPWSPRSWRGSTKTSISGRRPRRTTPSATAPRTRFTSSSSARRGLDV